MFKIIKRIFKINKNKVNFKLKKYDIVFVNMKLSEIILGSISESHSQRPFLITRVGLRKIKGYYMTGNLNNTYFKNIPKLKLILLKSKYKFQKDGLVLYNKKVKIPKKYIIFYMDNLKKDDIKKLNKYKKLLKRKNL